MCPLHLHTIIFSLIETRLFYSSCQAETQQIFKNIDGQREWGSWRYRVTYHDVLTFFVSRYFFVDGETYFKTLFCCCYNCKMDRCYVKNNLKAFAIYLKQLSPIIYRINAATLYNIIYRISDWNDFWCKINRKKKKRKIRKIHASLY